MNQSSVLMILPMNILAMNRRATTNKDKVHSKTTGKIMLIDISSCGEDAHNGRSAS